MGSVRTSILGRPRPLSGHRHADRPHPPHYTLNCEEPVYDETGTLAFACDAAADYPTVYSQQCLKRVRVPAGSSHTYTPYLIKGTAPATGGPVNPFQGSSDFRWGCDVQAAGDEEHA